MTVYGHSVASESAMSTVATSRANREGEVQDGYVSVASGLPKDMVVRFPEIEQYRYYAEAVN